MTAGNCNFDLVQAALLRVSDYHHCVIFLGAASQEFSLVIINRDLDVVTVVATCGYNCIGHALHELDGETFVLTGGDPLNHLGSKTPVVLSSEVFR